MSEHPKDLKVKIGTKDEVLWTNVKKESLALIEQSENNLKIQKEMLLLAEKKIREEEQKRKI